MREVAVEGFVDSVAQGNVALQHPVRYKTPTRLDPVQFRVAIPAADPPDNAPTPF